MTHNNTYSSYRRASPRISLEPNAHSNLQPSVFSLQPAPKAAFTLIEMLVVIVIIGILAGASLGLYQTARTTAWKQKTRDSARQIAVAWSVYLIDNHNFPPASSFQGSSGNITFQTLATNMSMLNSAKIYLEQSADQRMNGMKDKWGAFFNVTLDGSYGGTVPDPTDNTKTINANVVVWSTGPSPANKSSSYCVSWQ